MPGGPRFPNETVIVFAHFACREVDASLMKGSDLKLDGGEGCGALSLWLPASETDPQANGVLRRRGFICEAELESCVLKAAVKIYEHGSKEGAGDDDPFRGRKDRKVAHSKAAMAETVGAVGKSASWKESEVKDMTGHVLRATGAQ